MGTKSTVGVTDTQKSSLAAFQSVYQLEQGQNLNQGEAVARAAELAIKHVQECGGE